jgi:TolB-like protein
MTESRHTPSFFAELRRRKVVRVGIAYGAAAFIVLQIADLVFPALAVPDWFYRFLVIACLAGFPVAVLLAWLYDVTPEGVRRTGARDAGPVVARLGQIGLPALAGVGLLTVLFFAFVWVQPRSALGDVAPGADVIAVLPFTTSGDDVEVLREGMVDLLSRNLSQVGVIRTVDPRAVLFRWRERARDGVMPPEAAYALGREVGAGSILWGNVVELGGAIRMSAELVAVDGVELAAAEVEGGADDMLHLVDSLSVELIRSIWRATRPIPSVDLSTITSGNLTAIRHFLSGEQHYRASQWDSAVEDFSAAVEADSSFALAWVRLSYTSSWASRNPHRQELEQRAARKAVELVDRLPTRSQSLVRALGLWVSGQRAMAVDTLRSMAERYPDDLEAHYFLADAAYHITYEGLGPVRPSHEEALAPFEEIHALDPTFTPAFIHPFEVAFQWGDTALISRYYGTLRGRADTLALAIYRTGLQALRDPENVDTLAEALELAFVGTDQGLGTLGWQAARATTLPLLRQAALLDAGARATLYDLLRADESGARRISDIELRARRQAEVRLLQSGGQMAEAARLLNESERRQELTRGDVAYFSRTAVYAGFADPTRLSAGHDQGKANLESPLAELLAALDARDIARAHAAVERLRDDASPDEQRGRLARIGELFIAADSVPGAARLDAIQDALAAETFQPGAPIEPLWFRWLQRLAEHPDTRPAAIEILDRPWIGEPIYEPLRLHALARALELGADTARARALYLRYIAIMAAADDELPIEGTIVAARAALARIGS